MKKHLKNPLPFIVLLVGVGSVIMGQAQTFTTLHNFTAAAVGAPNSDGAYPYAGLTLSGDTLYGTAYQGGNQGWGTVFRIKLDGSGFVTVHSFGLTLRPCTVSRCSSTILTVTELVRLAG